MPAWQDRFNEALKRIVTADTQEKLLRAIWDTVTKQMGNATSIGLYDQESLDEDGHPIIRNVMIATRKEIRSIEVVIDTHLFNKIIGVVPTQRDRLIIIRDFGPRSDEMPEAVKRVGPDDTRSLAVLPLVVNGQHIGVMGIASPKPGGFARADIRLLEALSEYLATKLRDLAVLREVEESRRLFELLYEAAFRLEEGETRGDVLRQAVMELGGILGTGFVISGYVAGPRPKWPPEWLELVAHHTTGDVEGYSRPLDIGQRIAVSPEGYPIMDFLTDGRNLFHSADMTMDKRVDENSRRMMATSGVTSITIFPLVTRERWFGLLTISSPRRRLLSGRFLHQLHGFALRAAAIMESRWLLQRQVRANQLMENLIRLSRSIVFSPDMRRTVQSIAEALVSSLSAGLVRIWATEDMTLCTGCHWVDRCPESNRKCLVMVSAAGISDSVGGPFSRVPMGITTIGELAERTSPLIELDFRPDNMVLEDALRAKGNFEVFLGYPLATEREIVGVMTIFMDEKPEKSVLDFLEPFSHQVGGAIANAKMIRDARERAECEEVLSKVSARWQQALSLEPLLDMALSELGRFLRAEKARIRLAPNEISEDDGGPAEVGDE